MKLIETIQNKIKSLHPPGTSCDKDIAMAVLMRDPDNFASLINVTGFFAEKILPDDLVERDSRLASLRSLCGHGKDEKERADIVPGCIQDMVWQIYISCWS